MKKLLSISLVLILAGGVLMAENTKAEAMDPATAALVAAGVLLVPPFISALAHGPYYGPAPVYGGGYYGGGYYGGGYYGGSYPAQTRVIYRAPRYGGYYGGYQGRGYVYERGWREHREHREFRRGHDDYRGRYSGRHHAGDY
jgi:hypothetical protein